MLGENTRAGEDNRHAIILTSKKGCPKRDSPFMKEKILSMTGTGKFQFVHAYFITIGAPI
jgi:hypothetical protein